MSLFTSSQFASAAAEGADWREAAKIVLEKLESVKTGDADFNVGFLYVTDLLIDDAESILNLFKSVLNVEHWVGAVGVGICGCGEEFIDKPAIAAMVGSFDPDDFCMFPADPDKAQQILKPWLETKDPMLVLTHGDPLSEEDPAHTLKGLNTLTQGFMVGGLSSSRKQQMQFAGMPQQSGISGIAFSQNVNVATTLSQGCTPIGEAHTITRGDEHVILELDGEKAVGVFENDLRKFAIERIDQDPDEIVIDQDEIEDLENSDQVPDEFKNLLKGEVHVAFPVSESDQKDYLVRNIVGLDQDEGSITVSQYITNGERVIFVHRDDQSVREDLSKSLLDLRKRIQNDTVRFEPKGAVYVSCVARAFSQSEPGITGEMKLVREIIGDVPLVGFYAGGEISNARLYGYTGILTLFL